MTEGEVKARDNLRKYLGKTIRECERLADMADYELDVKKMKDWEITMSILIKIRAGIE